MIYAVFAEARSGTHYFESTLGQHPEIKSCHEILPNNKNKTDFHFYWLERIKKDPDAIQPHSRPKIFEDYLTYLESLFPEKTAIIIDIKYHQVDWIPMLMNVLKLKKVKIIHLLRRNILKLYLSNLLNRNKKELNRPLHTVKGGPDVEAVKIQLDLNDLIANLKLLSNVQNRHTAILSHNFDYLEVSYEDCINGRERDDSINSNVLEKIYTFIGIQDRNNQLQTHFTKMNSNTLSDLIENYQDVYNILKDTEWNFVFNENL